MLYLQDKILTSNICTTVTTLDLEMANRKMSLF